MFNPEDDKGFGQRVNSSKLEEYNGCHVHPADRAAAMWAAANPDQFAEARGGGRRKDVEGHNGFFGLPAVLAGLHIASASRRGETVVVYNGY
jgi:hypothetical protein